MKNGAATRTEMIIYGVSIGGLPLQVAKTYQWKNYNTKLNEFQYKKRRFALTFVLPRSGLVLLPVMVSLQNFLRVKTCTH